MFGFIFGKVLTVLDVMNVALTLIFEQTGVMYYEVWPEGKISLLSVFSSLSMGIVLYTVLGSCIRLFLLVVSYW